MTEYTRPKNTNPAAPVRRQGGTPAAAHAEAHLFVPTDRQRRAKANLVSAVNEGKAPRGVLGFADAPELAKLSRTPAVHEWARTPGFMAWFTDTDDFGARLAFLQDLALDSAEQVLRDPDPKSNSAKVALAIKLLGMEQDKVKDKKKLDNEDLETMVRAHRQLILQILGLPASQLPATLAPATTSPSSSDALPAFPAKLQEPGNG